MTSASRGHRRPHPHRRQDDHHGGHGLRPHHPGPGPDPVPLRHPRPGPLLVHVGRPRTRRHRRRRPRRHPPPRRLLPRRRLLRELADSPSSSPSTASTDTSPTPPTKYAKHSRSAPTPPSSSPTPATAPTPRARSSPSSNTPSWHACADAVRLGRAIRYAGPHRMAQEREGLASGRPEPAGAGPPSLSFSAATRPVSGRIRRGASRPPRGRRGTPRARPRTARRGAAAGRYSRSPYDAHPAAGTNLPACASSWARSGTCRAELAQDRAPGRTPSSRAPAGTSRVMPGDSPDRSGFSPRSSPHPALSSAMAAPAPSRWKVATTWPKKACCSAASGSSETSTGSCATTRASRSGCRISSSTATIAPELVPKTYAGAPSGATRSSSRQASSACSPTRWSTSGPSSGLREWPRGS